RLPKELVAWPPGCGQLGLVSAAGMTIGSVELSFWPAAESFDVRTASRLPGSTTSFSPVIPSSKWDAELQPETKREIARIGQSRLVRMVGIVPFPHGPALGEGVRGPALLLGAQKRCDHIKQYLCPLAQPRGYSLIGNDCIEIAVGHAVV